MIEFLFKAFVVFMLIALYNRQAQIYDKIK